MAIRLYLMPTIGTGADHDPIRPKYRQTILDNSTESDNYVAGDEPQCIAVVHDITAQGHSDLIANADVVALPVDLDSQIGANLATVQNALDNRNIPSNWVQATFTYRQVIRIIIQMFRFHQRVQAFRSEGVVTPLFGGTVTLATRFNQLPAGVRTRLINAATDLGFDTTGMSGATTLRVILKALADQFPGISMSIGGEDF